MSDERFRRLAAGAAFGALFSCAAAVFATPAALNEIGRAFHASDGALGTLYFVQAVGYIIAVILGGRVADRKGKLPVVAVGCLLLGAGAGLFVIASSMAVAFGAILTIGVGGGLTEGMATAAVADLYKGARRTAMLNTSQVMFGVGAVVSPIAISSLIHTGVDWRLGFAGAGALCLVASLVALIASFEYKEKISITHGESAWRDMLRDPLVIWLSVGIMLYVGAECGQGNWLAVYFKKGMGASAAFAASMPAFFWGGISLGRATGALLSKRMSDYAIICWALGLSAVIQAVLLVMHSPLAAMWIVAILGFCSGPVWPTIMSRAGAAYPKQSGTVFGIIIAMGTVGYGIFPASIGWVSQGVGIRSALWICFAILIVNLVIFTRLKASRHSVRGE